MGCACSEPLEAPIETTPIYISDVASKFAVDIKIGAKKRVRFLGNLKSLKIVAYKTNFHPMMPEGWFVAS